MVTRVLMAAVLAATLFVSGAALAAETEKPKKPVSKGEPSKDVNESCFTSAQCIGDLICCNVKGKAVCTPANSCKGVVLE